MIFSPELDRFYGDGGALHVNADFGEPLPNATGALQTTMPWRPDSFFVRLGQRYLDRRGLRHLQPTFRLK